MYFCILRDRPAATQITCVWKKVIFRWRIQNNVVCILVRHTFYCDSQIIHELEFLWFLKLNSGIQLRSLTKTHVENEKSKNECKSSSNIAFAFTVENQVKPSRAKFQELKFAHLMPNYNHKYITEQKRRLNVLTTSTV